MFFTLTLVKDYRGIPTLPSQCLNIKSGQTNLDINVVSKTITQTFARKCTTQNP